MADDGPHITVQRLAFVCSHFMAFLRNETPFKPCTKHQAHAKGPLSVICRVLMKGVSTKLEISLCSGTHCPLSSLLTNFIVQRD